MRVVAGLGNPGKEYHRTPHNVGFEVVERLAASVSCELRKSPRYDSRIGKAVLGSEDVLLMEPETFMNRSGVAIAAVLRYRQAGPGDLVVVVDDADLEIGRVRVRSRGGSGGHRGLASIIENLQTDEFPRVRIGIGRDEGRRGLVEHVLSPFSAEEWNRVVPVLDRAAEAVRCLVESGVDAAMNQFNA